uniref:Pancreatic trypsin inhibitor n=1 Tax=Rhipicephalus zambeziensis TaxID=60191 RepID=A0A224Y830_9ACAR
MDSVRRLFFIALIVCSALTEAAEAQKGKRDEEEQDNPTDQAVKNECWLKPNYHRCKDYVPRWYYDTTYLLCKPYLYGGCGGKNVNAFKSHEECMTRCMFEVPQVGGRSGGQGGRRPIFKRG